MKTSRFPPSAPRPTAVYCRLLPVPRHQTAPIGSKRHQSAPNGTNRHLKLTSNFSPPSPPPVTPHPATRKAAEGYGRSRKATEGHGRLRKVAEGRGRLRKATEGYGKTFPTPPHAKAKLMSPHYHPRSRRRNRPGATARLPGTSAPRPSPHRPCPHITPSLHHSTPLARPSATPL